jgi:hypothetical protein
MLFLYSPCHNTAAHIPLFATNHTESENTLRGYDNSLTTLMGRYFEEL